MICKLCAVIAVCLIVGSLCWIPAIRSDLESKFGRAESVKEKKRIDRKLWTACLLISIFEIGFIAGAAWWIGPDRIFDDGNFTGVVWAAIDGPILYVSDRVLKRKVKNPSVSFALKLIFGMIVIVAVAFILQTFGFADIFGNS